MVTFLPAEAYFPFQLIHQKLILLNSRRTFLGFRMVKTRRNVQWSVPWPLCSGWADMTRGQNTIHRQDILRHNSSRSHSRAKPYGSCYLQRDWKAIYNTGPKLGSLWYILKILVSTPARNSDSLAYSMSLRALNLSR